MKKLMSLVVAPTYQVSQLYDFNISSVDEEEDIELEHKELNSRSNN